MAVEVLVLCHALCGGPVQSHPGNACKIRLFAAVLLRHGIPLHGDGALVLFGNFTAIRFGHGLHRFIKNSALQGGLHHVGLQGLSPGGLVPVRVPSGVFVIRADVIAGVGQPVEKAFRFYIPAIQGKQRRVGRNSRGLIPQPLLALGFLLAAAGRCPQRQRGSQQRRHHLSFHTVSSVSSEYGHPSSCCRESRMPPQRRAPADPTRRHRDSPNTGCPGNCPGCRPAKTRTPPAP